MNRQKSISVGLGAILILSLILTPGVAKATDGREEKPIRLVAAVWQDPIGQIASEVVGSGLMVNGRVASPHQSIWAGDQLHLQTDISTPVVLDSIGRIMLTKGTVVRLFATTPEPEVSAKRTELIASLAQGEINIRLEPGAVARVRAGGYAFASSEGAVFNAAFRDGIASVAVKSGAVRKDPEQASQQHEYTIRSIGHGSNIKVPASGTRQIQLQIVEDNLPVPGVAVLFVLDMSGAVNGKLGVGTLSNSTLNVVTNSNGIAAVQFVAGPTAGTIPVSATVEGTRASWTGQITVTSKGMSRSTGWAIAALIGAGAAAGIVYALTRDKDDLAAQPPTLGQP